MERTKELDDLVVALSARKIVNSMPGATGSAIVSKETLREVIKLLNEQLNSEVTPEQPGWKQLSYYPTEIEKLLTEYVTRQAIIKLKNGEIV